MQAFLEANEGAVLFASFVASVFLAALLEMSYPRRADLSALRFRWLNNLGLALVNQLNDGWVVVFAAYVVSVWTAGENIGILAGLNLGFFTWVVLAIVVFEFIAYWFHRALHHFPLLWRIHAVHHSDTEVDFTTVLRNHPLEILFIAPITVPTVVLLGFPPAAVVVYQMLRVVINTFAHGNLRLSESADRLLRRFIVTPDFHRLHHCIQRRFTDSNFCPAFPMYDYLFGTASNRPYADHETMTLGLEYLRAREDSRIDRLLLLPFVWRQRPGPDRVEFSNS